MKIKYNYELLSGGIFAVLAAVVWFLIPDQIQTLESSEINAQTFPRLAIGGLFIFSTALFIQGLIRPKREVVLNKELFKTDSFKKESRSLIFAGILIVYGLVFELIGFILATTLLSTAILLFYHCKKWWYYAIAIATVFVVYFVFTDFLNVRLPSLILESL